MRIFVECAAALQLPKSGARHGEGAGSCFLLVGLHDSRRRFPPHYIRFMLQCRIVVDECAFRLQLRLHPYLRLLYYMPGFMRQVRLLPRSNVDVGSLRIGQRIELRGLGRVVMNLDIVQGDAGKRFDTGLQVVGQAGVVFVGNAIRFNSPTLHRVEFSLQELFLLGPALPLYRGNLARHQRPGFRHQALIDKLDSIIRRGESNSSIAGRRMMHRTGGGRPAGLSNGSMALHVHAPLPSLSCSRQMSR